MKKNKNEIWKKYIIFESIIVSFFISLVIYGCSHKTNEDKLYEYAINSKNQKINNSEFNQHMEKMGAKISRDTIQGSISVVVGNSTYILNMWDSTLKVSEIFYRNSKVISAWRWDTLGTRTKTEISEYIE